MKTLSSYCLALSCMTILAGCGAVNHSLRSSEQLAGVKSVAILEFKTVEEKDNLGQVIGGSLINRRSGEIMTDVFFTVLQNASDHNLLERNQLSRLLTEKRLSETDLVAGGGGGAKLANVDGIVIGQASLYSTMAGWGGGVYCTARLVTADGSTVWTLNLNRWRLLATPTAVANKELAKALKAIYAGQ